MNFIRNASGDYQNFYLVDFASFGAYTQTDNIRVLFEGNEDLASQRLVRIDYRRQQLTVFRDSSVRAKRPRSHHALYYRPSRQCCTRRIADGGQFLNEWLHDH